MEPEVDDVTVGAEQFIIPPVYDEEQQGRFLLGSVPDGLTSIATGADHISVVRDNVLNQRLSLVAATNALEVRRVSTNALLYAGLDVGTPDLDFVSTNGIPIRITSTATDAWGGFVYKLQYQEAMNQTWVDYCEDGASAVAMQGVWTSTGFHKNTTDISFGCRDGVTFKCFDWGYAPGPYIANPPPTIPISTSRWNLHLACTRMARMDVCGNGIPHTRELTPIVIRDRVPNYNAGPYSSPALPHVTTMPPPPDWIFYESAWTAGKDVGAVCLERQRWASLPVGFACGALEDPRNLNSAGKFCEDMTSDQLDLSEAWLVNGSRTYDMFLHRWRSATGDVFSTVRGYYSKNQSQLQKPFAVDDVYIGPDGILLRNLPGSLDEVDDVIEVFSTGTADRVLLPDARLDRTNPLFEGYLLKRNGGDRVPFGLFKRHTDTVTSVDPRDTTFTYDSPMYYVIKP